RGIVGRHTAATCQPEIKSDRRDQQWNRQHQDGAAVLGLQLGYRFGREIAHPVHADFLWARSARLTFSRTRASWARIVSNCSRAKPAKVSSPISSARSRNFPLLGS